MSVLVVVRRSVAVRAFTPGILSPRTRCRLPSTCLRLCPTYYLLSTDLSKITRRRIGHQVSPGARAVARLDQMLGPLEFLDQAARLRAGADGDPQVPLEVRVVAPVAHQDVLLAEAPGNLRSFRAHADKDEVGGAGRVGYTYPVEPPAEQRAVRLQHLGVAPHGILVLDSR